MDITAGNPGDREPGRSDAEGAAIRATVHRVTVVDAQSVTPLLRRVTVHAPTIAALALRPAQDVGLVFTDVGPRELRRRYTITRVDPPTLTLTLDGVLHGDGPGATWFASAAPGEEIDVFGPRGKIELASGEVVHLFVGDESGLPAFAELLAALPAGARAVAVIEVASAAEEQLLDTAAQAEVRWVHRDGRPAGRADLLTAALARVEPLTQPVQAYVLGESRAVVALGPALSALGVSRAQTFVKGYWNRPRGL